MSTPAQDESSVYGLPIYRNDYRAASPNGIRSAEIASTQESSMGNPGTGELAVSDALRIERCNPSFIWSSDSRYLAVPQMINPPGLFFRVRMRVIDTRDREVFSSLPFTDRVQPETFDSGLLVVCVNPWSASRWSA